MANSGGATTEIPLTNDHFQCEVLLEAVRAEGVEAHLLIEAPDAGGQGFGVPNRLLVFERDLEAVKAVLERSFPVD